MPTTTTNYSWNKPTIDGDESTWGGFLNGNWDALDTLLGGVSATEFGYLDGVTSAVQTQIDAKITADVTGEFIADSYNETFVTLTAAATVDVDCETGNVFALTTDQNTTFTFSNPPASGTAYGFMLRLTAGGTHTITYPASVDWAGATAPDAPASGETDVLVFTTTDGGTTWYGALAIDAAG